MVFSVLVGSYKKTMNNGMLATAGSIVLEIGHLGRRCQMPSVLYKKKTFRLDPFQLFEVGGRQVVVFPVLVELH
jgi:hypothetical protein